MAGEPIVTAAALVIGDEILSGRTRDQNINYIAAHLTRVGIRLQEVRVVADDEDAIVAAVNELRARYTYLFTTGGIGPTHDDITADAVAKALGVAIGIDRARARVAGGALRQKRASRRRRRVCAWRASQRARRSFATRSRWRRAS